MVANRKIVNYYHLFYSQANTNWGYDNRDVVDLDDGSNLVTTDKTLYYASTRPMEQATPYRT